VGTPLRLEVFSPPWMAHALQSVGGMDGDSGDHHNEQGGWVKHVDYGVVGG